MKLFAGFFLLSITIPVQADKLSKILLPPPLLSSASRSTSDSDLPDPPLADSSSSQLFTSPFRSQEEFVPLYDLNDYNLVSNDDDEFYTDGYYDDYGDAEYFEQTAENRSEPSPKLKEPDLALHGVTSDHKTSSLMTDKVEESAVVRSPIRPEDIGHKTTLTTATTAKSTSRVTIKPPSRRRSTTMKPSDDRVVLPQQNEGQSYSFSYNVGGQNEDHPKFSRQEESDGTVVKGEYRVLLPNGLLQIVSYTSSSETGFLAKVSYERP